MGFDFDILLSLRIDKATGLPIVGWTTPVPYSPEDHQVPENFRKFLKMRGHHLRYYTQTAELDSGGTLVDAASFKFYFPTWESINDECDWSNYDWSEELHHEFKEAVTWFAEKDIFTVQWSY